MCEKDPQCGVAVMGYSVLARMLLTRAELAGLAGRLADARADQDRGIALARDFGAIDLVGWGLPAHGLIEWLAGSHDNALEHALQAAQIGEETGNAMTIIFALMVTGMVQSSDGDHEAAVVVLNRAVALGRERNIRFYEAKRARPPGPGPPRTAPRIGAGGGGRGRQAGTAPRG